MTFHRASVPHRNACWSPGCRTDDGVRLRHGPRGELAFLCDEHGAAVLDEAVEAAVPERPWRRRFGLGLSVSAAILVVGALEAVTGLATVAWNRAFGTLAPAWAAACWDGGVSLAMIGLVTFVFFLLVEHAVEGWLR